MGAAMGEQQPASQQPFFFGGALEGGEGRGEAYNSGRSARAGYAPCQVGTEMRKNK